MPIDCFRNADRLLSECRSTAFGMLINCSPGANQLLPRCQSTAPQVPINCFARTDQLLCSDRSTALLGPINCFARTDQLLRSDRSTASLGPINCFARADHLLHTAWFLLGTTAALRESPPCSNSPRRLCFGLFESSWRLRNCARRRLTQLRYHLRFMEVIRSYSQSISKMREAAQARWRPPGVAFGPKGRTMSRMSPAILFDMDCWPVPIRCPRL